MNDGAPRIIADVIPEPALSRFCASHPDEAAAFIQVAIDLVGHAEDVPSKEVTALDWANWVRAIIGGCMDRWDRLQEARVTKQVHDRQRQISKAEK